MFGRLFAYRLKRLVNEKDELFWNAIFPILLGLFFYMAFSGISEKTESMNQVPVAVMMEQETPREQALWEFLTMMSEEGEMIEIVQSATMEEAEELLKSGEVTGILMMRENVTLKFADDGMNQTLLKYLINRYLQAEAVIMKAAAKSPEAMQAAVAELYGDATKNEELSIAPGDMDPYASYFFALMAMSCMFAATFGLTNTREIQITQSTVAARRCVSPTPKALMVVTDFMAMITIQYAIFLLQYAFMTFVLGVDFGNQYGRILLAGAVASLNGAAFGYMIGVVIKGRKNTKNAVITTVTLVLNFFAGLMVLDMKYIVEQNMPWLNRINPAALISDCFASLSVFSNNAKYDQCIVTLLIEAAIFGAVAAVVLRKQKA